MKSVRPSCGPIRHASAPYGLRLGRSPIHRYGVFACEDIPCGRQVIEYTGRRLSPDQAFLLKPPHDDYLIHHRNGPVINGSVGGSGAEFINHGCNPNLTWRRRRGRLFFYSIRRIPADQELTAYFSHPIKARVVPCACGARKCRKILRYIASQRADQHDLTLSRKVLNKKYRMLPRIKSKYARYRLRTALSGIHRFGVYALEDIPASRIVIEYTGKRMSWAKASRVPFEKSIYIANLKRGFVIDGRIGGSGAEYVNHSCEPNLKPKRIAGHLFFWSRRKIRSGEELTMDYKYSIKLRRILCRCGARTCRKTFRVEFRK